MHIYFGFPVICKILPTEPERELINLPQDNKINAETPTLNSSPNKPKKNSGKIKKSMQQAEQRSRISF